MPASRATTAKATVSNMRAVLVKLKDMGVSPDEIASISWDNARIRADGKPGLREY